MEKSPSEVKEMLFPLPVPINIYGELDEMDKVDETQVHQRGKKVKTETKNLGKKGKSIADFFKK
jgi:hypothetical protein